MRPGDQFTGVNVEQWPVTQDLRIVERIHSFLELSPVWIAVTKEWMLLVLVTLTRADVLRAKQPGCISHNVLQRMILVCAAQEMWKCLHIKEGFSQPLNAAQQLVIEPVVPFPFSIVAALQSLLIALQIGGIDLLEQVTAIQGHHLSSPPTANSQMPP